MNVLIACECSAVVRDAFRALGHNAWSCDLKECRGDPEWHIQDDVLNELQPGRWDLMIAHPECTRLANSGVRWLHKPPTGKTVEQMWEELKQAAEFYKKLRDAPVPRKAIENPVMHKYARELINPGKRQIVQPWHFGEPFFKATGFELFNLPALKDTNRLQPPEKGTEEHKEWSMIHRCPPGEGRAEIRSRTFPGIADAMADQWGRGDNVLVLV